MFNHEIPLWELALLNAQYKDKINLDTISNLRMRHVKKILSEERPMLVQQYSMYMLKKWIKQNETETFHYIQELKRIIKKLKINVAELEAEYILAMEERAFTKTRAIKVLETDIDFYKKEHMLAFFINGEIYKTEKSWEHLLYQSTLIISNKRFIFRNKNIYDKPPIIKFASIKKYSLVEQGCRIEMKDDKVYLLKIHDPRTLNITINQIFRKRVKNVYKRREDNKS